MNGVVKERLVVDATRVHIVGGPGTGKTHLATLLGRERGIDPWKLDDIAFDSNSRVASPLAKRLRDVDVIVATPSWVAEGVYLGWTDKLFAHADVIIWLDLPMRVALARKLPHHLRRTLRGRYPHAGMRNQLDHTRFMWRYYRSGAAADLAAGDDDTTITRAATAQALTTFSDKVVVCRRPADVNALTRARSRRPSLEVTGKG